jgi:HEAT repeat protein
MKTVMKHVKPIPHLSRWLCLGLILIVCCGVDARALAGDATADHRDQDIEEALRSLTQAVATVRTNAVGDPALLLSLLKANDPREANVLAPFLATEFIDRRVGPYVVLPRQRGVILALQVWASMTEATPLVPALIDSMGSEDPVLAHAAAAALGVMGRHALRAVPTLMDAARVDAPIGSGRLAMSRNAVAALGDVSGGDSEVVALLTRILRDSRDQVMRENAVISLGKQGELASEAGEMLREMLRNPGGTGGIEIHAARSLVSIAPNDPETLDALERMVGHDEWHMRRWGILALGGLGGDPAVIKLLKSVDRDFFDPGNRNRDLAESILRLYEDR